MADSGGPEEDYVAIFSPGGSGSSNPPASPTGSSLGTPGEDSSPEPPTHGPSEAPTEPVGVVGKILSGPTGGTSSVEGGSDAAGVKTGITEPVTPFPASPTRTGDGSSGAQSPPVALSPEMLRTIVAAKESLFPRGHSCHL